jgi:hypothetical protein
MSFQFANRQELRAERGQLQICAAASCPSDVSKECLRRFDEVNLAIPTIVFELKDGTGPDIRAARVRMDGELLTERLGGGALAVDPGEHRFQFELPGRLPFQAQLVIRESEKERHELVTWPQSSSGKVVPPRANESHHAKLSSQQVSAIAAGTIGVVGVSVGTVFGLEAISKKQSAQDVCPASKCPTEEGVNRWGDAKSAGNVATAAFIVAGVGFLGAAVLWFTDSSARDNVQIGLGPSSLQVKGAW